MEYNTFIRKMREAGDAYVFYTTPISKKTKYHICTIDLNSAKYIKNKINDLDSGSTDEGMIKAFCWDLDTFKTIDVSLVTKVVPLNTVLKYHTII